MPRSEQVAKATLQEIQWDENGTPQNKSVSGTPTQPFPVQFNPASLKLSYANQKSGGDQPKGSPAQFIGNGTTKLSLELWFDTTVDETNGNDPSDVRAKVNQVAALMAAKKSSKKNAGKFIPPGVRFQWGQFLFAGVVESLEETLEYFSNTGVPMRAQLSLTLSKQEISVEQITPPRNTPGAAAVAPAGRAPLAQARANDTVQQMAARSGSTDWKNIAAANGIENPRRLAAGALVNLSAGLVGGASLTTSLGLSAGASFGAGASAGVGVSLGGQASGSLSGSAMASASAGADVR
jgi:hypothetical protein